MWCCGAEWYAASGPALLSSVHTILTAVTGRIRLPRHQALSSCLQVQVQGPAPTPVTAGAVKAAVHSYTYCARTTGQYVISATIDGVHMRGSPASVTASTAEAHAPLCEVRGAPLTLTTVAGATALIAASPTPTTTVLHLVRLRSWPPVAAPEHCVIALWPRQLWVV